MHYYACISMKGKTIKIGVENYIFEMKIYFLFGGGFVLLLDGPNWQSLQQINLSSAEVSSFQNFCRIVFKLSF